MVPVIFSLTGEWISRDFTLTSVDGSPGLGLQAHVVKVLIKRLLWRILDNGRVHAFRSLLRWRVGRPHSSLAKKRLVLVAFQGRDI